MPEPGLAIDPGLRSRPLCSRRAQGRDSSSAGRGDRSGEVANPRARRNAFRASTPRRHHKRRRSAPRGKVLGQVSLWPQARHGGRAGLDRADVVEQDRPGDRLGSSRRSTIGGAPRSSCGARSGNRVGSRSLATRWRARIQVAAHVLPRPHQVTHRLLV